VQITKCFMRHLCQHFRQTPCRTIHESFISSQAPFHTIVTHIQREMRTGNESRNSEYEHMQNVTEVRGWVQEMSRDIQFITLSKTNAKNAREGKE
jgi:hypothetical protein